MKTSLLLTLAAALALATSAHAQTYSVTDLGSLNGAPTCATAIHDNDMIAGSTRSTETSPGSSAVAKQSTQLTHRIP